MLDSILLPKLFSKMFNVVVEWESRPDNPAKGIQRYDEQRRDRWLSGDELRRLCQVLEEHPNTMLCACNC